MCKFLVETPFYSIRQINKTLTNDDDRWKVCPYLSVSAGVCCTVFLAWSFLQWCTTTTSSMNWNNRHFSYIIIIFVSVLSVCLLLGNGVSTNICGCFMLCPTKNSIVLNLLCVLTCFRMLPVDFVSDLFSLSEIIM